MFDDKLDIEKLQDLADVHKGKTISISDVYQLIKEELRPQFKNKFPEEDFDVVWNNYNEIICFPALGNVYDYDMEVDKPTHFLMRMIASWHIEKALQALKFDTVNDPNLSTDSEIDNIGTPGRIAKIWAGSGLDSENIREYGDGRWTKQPRLATFPAKENDKGRPVTVVIKNPGIGSVCSHHFLPYSIQNNENSKIVVSYIPNKKLLGLSKIGRFIEWCMNRPSLQEEITELIFNKIKEIAETDDVYVGLIELVHQCEVSRGAKQFSTTTTEDYSGQFSDLVYRNSVLQRI